MKLYVTAATTLVLCGCNDATSASGNPASNKLMPSQEIAAQAQLDSLKDRVEFLEQKRVERLLVEHSSAVLDPNATGFSLIDTPVGPISLRIESVEPNANGSLLKVAIGNPTNATLLRTTANIEWGTVDENGREQKPVGKHDQFQLVDRLEPGRWKDVTIPLSNTAPAKVGYVRVHAASIGGIELLKE